MRALVLLLGLVAGAASVAFLSVAQLIWAQSEASYYVQLALAFLLLGSLFLLARKASSRMLGIAVLVTALLTALMPVENRFIALSSIAARNESDARIGDEVGGAAGFTGQLASIATGWLFYSVLLAIFAFGLRHWFMRRSPVSKPF